MSEISGTHVFDVNKYVKLNFCYMLDCICLLNWVKYQKVCNFIFFHSVFYILNTFFYMWILLLVKQAFNPPPKSNEIHWECNCMIKQEQKGVYPVITNTVSSQRAVSCLDLPVLGLRLNVPPVLPDCML